MSVLRYFLFRALTGGPLIQGCGTICVILEESIMRNNSVKLFLIWTSGSRGVV